MSVVTVWNVVLSVEVVRRAEERHEDILEKKEIKIYIEKNF